MAFCKYCGTYNADESKYCTNCGSPLLQQPRREESKPYAKQGTRPSNQAQEPREINHQTQHREQQWMEGSVQSQGHWVLDVFLSCIPLVGLILLIVWSVTDQPDLSKQRWARATLIWMIIVIVVVGVISILFGALFVGLTGAYM